MATTAKALVTLLEEACKDVSLSDEDTLKVADKLDGLGLKSVRDFAFYQGEAFTQTGSFYSEQVIALGNSVCTGTVSIDNSVARSAITRPPRAAVHV